MSRNDFDGVKLRGFLQNDLTSFKTKVFLCIFHDCDTYSSVGGLFISFLILMHFDLFCAIFRSLSTFLCVEVIIFGRKKSSHCGIFSCSTQSSNQWKIHKILQWSKKPPLDRFQVARRPNQNEWISSAFTATIYCCLLYSQCTLLPKQ